MDALLVCAEEIALDGLDGCPIIHLWKNLENASPAFPLKLDDASKSYLWKGIVEALDVSFYLLDQPLPRIFSNNKEKDRKKYLGGCKNFDVNSIDLAANPYSLVNDGKIRGSCPEYNTRKDITTEIRNSGQCLVMLEEAQERWGDKLVMVASQDMRNKALVPEVVDPNVSLTDIEYCILEHVGQARTKGRLQRCINMFLKIDARTTFHFLKKMKVLGLVTKQRFVTQSEPSKNIWSNIIRLKKFHSPCYHKYDILGHQICQKLQEQPDNTMALKDLREFFEESGAKERIIKRVRQDLQTSGHIELVLKRVPSCAKSNINRANKGLLRHYVKLIKPFPLWTGNEDNEEHDEDDDDNDDDDDGVQVCDGQPNVVMELSLLKQMYDFIESKAEHGASNKEIANGIKLSQYVHRALVKTLEKSGHIKPVLTYGGRQTFLRYVATPFVEESYHMSKILEEKKKLDAVKSLADTSSPSAGIPAETPIDSPCPSPGLSRQSHETLDNKSKDTTQEKKKPKSKSALAGKVTYRKLKRNNFIIEFLKTQKIVKGYQPILKAIQEAEEKEGLENKMDRVFLKRSLERLNEDGLIKKMTTVMEINNSSHSIDFYLHPSINSQDPAVQVALDQCRFQLYGDGNKSKASSRKKSKKDDNKTTDDDEEDKDEDEDEDLDPDKIISDHSIRYNYGYLAKFPRMRLLHEYLWQVIFGLKQRKKEAKNVNNPEQSGITHCGNPPTVESETKTSGNMNYGSVDSGSMDSGSKASENGKTTVVEGAELKKESQSTGEFDSKTHDYDWINYLESFPLYDMPIGWFKLVDATSIMPLSVFCNILGIVTEVDGLDEYYNDPKLKHTLIKDLPKKMQRRLKHKARYKQTLCGIVSNLMCAGLLAPKLPVPVERLMTEVHFSKGAIITNTTTSLPNYDKTQEPAGQTFTSNKFVFNSFSDVQAYWDEVMCVALNTPLGFIRTPSNSRERKWFKFSHCKTPVILEDSIVPPPGDGKGACGFDSYLHAHLGRNWSFCKSGNPKYGVPASEKREVKLQNGEPAAKKHKKIHKEPSKKPKPTVHKKTDKPKPKPKLKPKAKRPSFEKMIIRPPKKSRYIETPNIRTPCFSDKEKQKQTHNAGKHLISVDDVDREALAKVTGLRKNYSPETDKILILCRIGLEIMKKTSYRNPYPFPDIRDIVHEYCEDGANKTAPNCQSRLLRLMKNPKNVATINICVAEYSLYEEFMGLDNPDLPFSETFHFLMTKLIELSRTRVACLEDTSQLSSSLEELYQRFYVQRLSLPDDALSPFADTSVLGPPIQTVKDIRMSVVRDVIQISSHSEQAKYNSLGVFKMFDDFKMDEKDEAYTELLKTGLLIRKREYTTAFRRTIPFAPISCQLSYIYNKHFQPKGIQPSTFDEAILFLKQLNDSSKNPSQQGRPMPIKLLEDKIVGGDVASILSLLTINKVTVEFHVPDQLVQKDEKQQDNLRTKKKSRLTSELPSLIGPKQKKQKKDVKFAEGREAKKSKAKTKRKKTAAKRMSENERTDSEGDTANSTSTLEDDSKADEANTKQTAKGMPESEGTYNGGSSGENKSAFKNDLTREDVETAKLNKIEVSESKKNDNKEHGGNGKSAVKSLPTTEDGFVKPIGLPKEKAKRKDTAKESMQVGEEGQGTNEITSAGSNMKDLSTAQLKNKKTQENEKSKNAKNGTVSNADETDEALEDPFLDNELLVHCKFSTPIDLSSMNIKSLTPIYYSDTPSSPFAETNGDTDAAQTLKRKGRMKSKDLTGPILLTNSNEIALINNCSIFVRPKVSHGSQGNVSESDVSMDTQVRDKSLDILLPRSLDVILQNTSTLDAYLDTCNDIEGFNTSDAQICTLICKAANEVKDIGATMTSLKQMFLDKTSLLEEASFSLEQHFKKLCNAKLLLQVGIFEKRYVSPSFARSWCINFSKRKIVIPEESNEDNSQQPDGTLPASLASESLATSAPTEPDPSATEEVVTKTPASTTASPHPVAAAILSGAVQAETYKPVSIQPVSSATSPSTSLQAGTSEAVITQPLSSAAVSSESIQAGTSEAVTKQPLTAAPTASASMQAETSEPLTTMPVPSATTTLESMWVETSEAVTMQSVAPAATASTAVQAGTTEPLITQPVSSTRTPSESMMAETSEAVTFLPLSTAVMPSVAPVPTAMSKSSLCVSTDSTLNSTEATSPSSEMAMDDVNSLDMKLSESPSADLTRVVQGSSEENTDTSDKITSETSKRLPEESEAIISRPWLELNGSLNKVFLKSLLDTIMSEIIINPGITEIHIAQKFVNLIRPLYFAELLEYLESIGCITKHTLAMSKPMSLFSTTTEKKDEKKFIYYLPVVDCIVTLANAVQNWS